MNCLHNKTGICQACSDNLAEIASRLRDKTPEEEVDFLLRILSYHKYEKSLN